MTVSVKAPTSTTGSIQLNGSDVLTIESDNSVDIDSGTLHVDATNNRVGVGTSSPNTLFHVQGSNSGGNVVVATLRNNNTAGSTQTTLRFTNSTADGTSGGGELSYLRNSADQGASFIVKTQSSGGVNTERMRIDSGGNVLVATTTNNSRNSRLALNGNSVTWSVGPNSSNSTFVVYNPSEAGVYLPSGNTAWVSTSDERLKNITGEITDAINKVSQLRAAEFTWKSDESNKPQVGLIAQDVQTVLPEAISENDKEFLGVSYTEVIPLLVAAIKEQQEQIKALETRIQTLESA
jgi:hypothetical protein